jgi:glycosyltransferase involved in cell wall biosynthesis
MRVLLANKFFFRNGGSEVVLFNEKEFLTRAGAEVIDFAMQGEQNYDSPYATYFVSRQDYRDDGMFAKIKSSLSLIHSREAVQRITALIDKTRPHLLHCHNIYHQLTPSIITVAKARNIPVVLTLHDFKTVCPMYLRLRAGQPCSLCLDGDFSQVWKKRCAEGSRAKSALLYAEAIVQRWLRNYEKVDRFLAPSNFMRESVLRRFPPDRVEILRNGVDTAGIVPSERDENFVLYLGRLSPEKGVDTLLRAHDASMGAWSLVVAGTGHLMNDLKSRYSNVRFVGQLSGERLGEVLAGASVVVLPSECYENCPMAVLEAMAYGKPVVGSRIGGIPELIIEGETGFLFDPGNADGLRAHLDRLMNDKELRLRMGRAGRTRAEQEFSLEKHNANLMAIYRSLLRAASVRVEPGSCQWI